MLTLLKLNVLYLRLNSEPRDIHVANYLWIPSSARLSNIRNANCICSVIPTLAFTMARQSYFLGEDQVFGFKLCIKISSALCLSPYEWNSKSRKLELSRNSGQKISWLICRTLHMSYSLFAIVRLVFYRSQENLESLLLSGLWTLLSLTACWFNVCNLKQNDICNVINATFKIIHEHHEKSNFG